MAEPAPQKIIRALDAATSIEDVDREKRAITHKINTDCVDRYRTVILPKGMREENYRKNPVVLCNHNGFALPIARNDNLKVYPRKIIARTVFLPEGKDETADKVFELYRLGFLNGWSVSFDPSEYGKPTPDELRARPDWAEAEIIFRVWDLLEYSCVTVPGNQEACRSARSRGLSLPGWPDDDPPPPDRQAPELPPLVGRTPDDYLRAIRARVLGDLAGRRDEIRRDAIELARGMA